MNVMKVKTLSWGREVLWSFWLGVSGGRQAEGAVHPAQGGAWGFDAADPAERGGWAGSGGSGLQKTGNVTEQVLPPPAWGAVVRELGVPLGNPVLDLRPKEL